MSQHLETFLISVDDMATLLLHLVLESLDPAALFFLVSLIEQVDASSLKVESIFVIILHQFEFLEVFL